MDGNTHYAWHKTSRALFQKIGNAPWVEIAHHIQHVAARDGRVVAINKDGLGFLYQGQPHRWTHIGRDGRVASVAP